MKRQHEYWMQLALQQAQQAAMQNEVPVGAVLVDANNELIAVGHNCPISCHDPGAHAEMLALRRGAERLQNYRLVDTTLYVTLEPCIMCVGAIIHARVKRLVYGASEPKTGAVQSRVQLLEPQLFNHTVEVESGILEQSCATIMSEFFARRRSQKKFGKKS